MTKQESSFSEDVMSGRSDSPRQKEFKLQRAKTQTAALAARPQNNFPTATSAMGKSQISRGLESNLKEGGSFENFEDLV